MQQSLVRPHRAAQTDLLWRELLIGTSPAVGGELNAKQTGRGKMGVGPLEEFFLLLPLLHSPHSPQKDPHSQMNG